VESRFGHYTKVSLEFPKAAPADAARAVAAPDAAEAR